MGTANRPRLVVRFALAASLALVATAHASDVEPPPQPNRQLALVTPLAGYALMGLATAGLVGISLIRARRGEQD